MVIKTLDQYKKAMMKDPKFRREWETLELEYALKRRMIELGIAGNFSLKSIAAEAGITQASILRFRRGEFSDEISTVCKIASGLGMKLEVRVV